jgi:hypothetical protein
LPIQFRRNETSLRLFTTIATLGTPRDVTLQEVRIEFFFPMDEATAQTLRAWETGREISDFRFKLQPNAKNA